MNNDDMRSTQNNPGADFAIPQEDQMTLTDKLGRMAKLVNVMRDDEEALAAYKTLQREVESEFPALLMLARNAGFLTPSKWDHVAIIDDINDVLGELLPESHVLVTDLNEDGFGVEWIHNCGASLCHLAYGDGPSCLGVKIPRSKTMTMAMSSIANNYGLAFHDYFDDDDKDDDEVENNDDGDEE